MENENIDELENENDSNNDSISDNENESDNENISDNENESDSDNESEKETETDSETENKTDNEKTTETVTEKESETKSETENEKEIESESKIESDTETDTETETETETEIETETESGIYIYFDSSDDSFNEFLQTYSASLQSDSVAVASSDSGNSEILGYLDEINSTFYRYETTFDEQDYYIWDFFRIYACVGVINTFGIFCILGVLLANCFFHRLQH
jgi:hypothetical protein